MNEDDTFDELALTGDFEIWINKGPESTEMVKHTAPASLDITGDIGNMLWENPRWSEGLWIVEIRKTRNGSVFRRAERDHHDQSI